MIKAVLFDLDGTLLNSAPDLVAALNAVRAKHGLDPLSVSSMENHATAGALSLLQAGMPAADDATLEEWRLLFLDHYQEHIFESSSLYAGATGLIRYLENNGFGWGIVTNKPEYLSIPVIAEAGINQGIGTLVCGDTLPEKKPHPAPVLLACEQLDLPPENVMFVGDDPRDLEAGRAAGVMNCAAMFGYGSPAFLQPEHQHLFNPGLAIDSLSDLELWLRERGN